MKRKKCIHVVATDGFEPQMCSLTLPTIKAYADKIGADLNVISQRKMTSWPVVYEKMQIYEIGRAYEWNISLDADMVIHPELADITLHHPPEHVGNWWYYTASSFLNVENNPYFIRDGRNYGIVDCFVMTSRLTHDLWEPLDGSFDDHKDGIKGHERWRAGEFCISQNLAKYGLKISGALTQENKLYHINTSGLKIENSAQLAYLKLKEWGMI